MEHTASELIDAVQQGDAEAVRAMLAAQPDLAQTRKADGVSLLLAARYQGNTAMTDALRSSHRALDIFEAAAFDDAPRVRQLLGADPGLARAWSPDGFTALHLAAFFGGPEGARALIDAGADLDAYSRNDFTVAPLHSAAAGREAVASLLVERGAQLNVKQRHGWTPLHSATNNGYAALVEQMLAAGADAAATNDDGVTALDLARKRGHVAIAERLERESVRA